MTQLKTVEDRQEIQLQVVTTSETGVESRGEVRTKYVTTTTDDFSIDFPGGAIPVHLQHKWEHGMAPIYFPYDLEGHPILAIWIILPGERKGHYIWFSGGKSKLRIMHPTASQGLEKVKGAGRSSIVGKQRTGLTVEKCSLIHTHLAH